MKDQHTKITGYRDLTQEEIDLMNEAKQIGLIIENFLSRIESYPSTDKLWVAEAKTDLQKGIMCAVRSIAKPDSF